MHWKLRRELRRLHEEWERTRQGWITGWLITLCALLKVVVPLRGITTGISKVC